MAGCRTPRSGCHHGTSWTSPTKASHGPLPCFSPPACCLGPLRLWIRRSGVRRKWCWWGHWTAHCTEQVSSVQKCIQCSIIFSRLKGSYSERRRAAYPSGPGVCWAMLSTYCKLEEVLWDGDAKEEWDADDEEVAHRVHVGELHKREPHSSWKDQTKPQSLGEQKSGEAANPITEYYQKRDIFFWHLKVHTDIAKQHAVYSGKQCEWNRCEECSKSPWNYEMCSELERSFFFLRSD